MEGSSTSSGLQVPQARDLQASRAPCIKPVLNKRWKRCFLGCDGILSQPSSTYFMAVSCSTGGKHDAACLTVDITSDWSSKRCAESSDLFPKSSEHQLRCPPGPFCGQVLLIFAGWLLATNASLLHCRRLQWPS